MRGIAMIGLLLALATSACTKLAPSPATDASALDGPALDERVAAARAFQHDYDESLRADETSCLTAVAAHYLAPGERLESEVGGRSLELIAEPERLEVRVDERVLALHDAEPLVLDDAARWRLVVSRQDHEWRVLVHDRDAEARRDFTGIAWFPIDASRIVDARFIPAPTRNPKQLQTSRGLTKTLHVAGVYQFELEGRTFELEAFAYGSEPQPDEPLLIPFRDQTSGDTSYGGGRYLEPTLPEPGVGSTSLDFNRATNPLCAYSEHYNCPMPPAFNRLDLVISAGAATPH